MIIRNNNDIMFSGKYFTGFYSELVMLSLIILEYFHEMALLHL